MPTVIPCRCSDSPYRHMDENETNGMRLTGSTRPHVGKRRRCSPRCLPRARTSEAKWLEGRMPSARSPTPQNVVWGPRQLVFLSDRVQNLHIGNISWADDTLGAQSCAQVARRADGVRRPTAGADRGAHAVCGAIARAHLGHGYQQHRNRGSRSFKTYYFLEFVADLEGR